MQDLFEPRDPHDPMLLAIPSFSESMEAVMNTEIHAEHHSTPRNSMEHVNESPDTVTEGANVFEDADTATPDDGEIDDSDEESAPTPLEKQRVHELPPTIKQLEDAMEDLEKLLRPPRRDKRQKYKDPSYDTKTIKRLEAMRLLCFNVLELEKAKAPGEKCRGIWTKASVTTARSLGHSAKNSITPGKKKAKELRKWLRLFIDDREEVPSYNWSTSGRSLIDDEDFAQEIHAHLQTLGPYFSAEAIVRFIDTPEMLERLQRKKTILLMTAQRWMKKMDYRWTINPKSQYVDGHEREDVVSYWNNIFLPSLAKLEERTRKFGSGDMPDSLAPGLRRVVVWYHDESTFYANDRRRTRWVHKSETAKPYAKGEGHSLMAAHFVSADYGWLTSPDGKKSARILFRVGKAREGYFDNDNIWKHLALGMELTANYYPDDDHVFVFDNATTHLKRPEGSLSALKMPKGPSANFGVDVNIIGDDGKPVYGPNSKILKQKIPMGNGYFEEGGERKGQAFYWRADSHLPHAGQFKGMVAILEEHGFKEASKMRAQCQKKFADCPPGQTQCCCRRTLFNQPDFVNVESILEMDAREKGYSILFLPKFHCELNFIEQCWGYAKRNYRLLPPSSNEDILEKNVVQCLDEIPLITMRRSVGSDFDQ